ncbi:MAG: DUF924 family protein [Pseudomonadota bacterium]
MTATPEEIINFWRAAGPKKWWRKAEDFDAAIATRFGDTHKAARKGTLDHWADEPNAMLALILVLDQFTRNLHRNSADAFAQDAKGLSLAKRAVAKGHDAKMPEDLRSFCYLPFMHSEELADQETCIALMEAHGGEDNIKAAREHRDIIAKFGRFPHRNPVLGRAMTDEEQAFLDDGGFKG